MNTGCVLGRYSMIKAHLGGTVELGSCVAIGGRGCISAAHSGSCVALGDDCILSYDVSIWGDHGHALIDLKTHENKTVTSANSVKLGPHVWLGNKVTVLPGSMIGANCIIGANSLVKGCFGRNKVLAGNPASVIHDNYTWDRQIDISVCEDTAR